MKTAFRSVLTANRSSLTGTATILTLSAILLTATGAWLEAGLRNENLLVLVSIAGSFAGTVVLITVFIVASVFAAALRQRQREFALLRAIGSTTGQVRGTVTSEALVVLLITTPIGGALGLLIAPLLTPLLQSGGLLPGDYTLPVSVLSVLAAIAILVPTGLIAARAGARGILRLSPTAAVRESTSEVADISRTRVLVAAGLGVAGLLAAGTPFIAPGTIGSATGASSAIVLIIAAALAGPALVRWAAIRAASATRTSNGPARVLALSNARGFSRRLSAAIIPLALLVALGSVQSGVDTAIGQATTDELRAGVIADLVVTSPSGLSEAQSSAITGLPGVSSVSGSEHQAASVRVEAADEEMPAMDALNWESVTLLTITPGSSAIDPRVQTGTLQDLGDADTIAVSRDALLFTGKGLGDTIDVRAAGQEPVASRIVAIYERGLGFGDYITGASNPTAGQIEQQLDTVYVTTATLEATKAALTGMGLTAVDPAEHARAASQGAGGEQTLSLILLLALLGFVAAAAANTLITATSTRRDEFALLKRIGATRAQILRMVAVETGFIITASLAIGLLAVLPALTGAGQGLLGTPLPVFDVPVTAGLAGSVIIITILTVIVTAWQATSPRTSQR